MRRGRREASSCCLALELQICLGPVIVGRGAVEYTDRCEVLSRGLEGGTIVCLFIAPGDACFPVAC